MSIKVNYMDPISGTTVPTYGKESQFLIYVRKFNGKRRLVFVGRGDDLPNVLQTFHSYPIFKHDRKYLYHRKLSDPAEYEEPILRVNGMAKRSGVRKYGKDKVNYRWGYLSTIRHIPLTLMTDLQSILDKSWVIRDKILTKALLVQTVLAAFIDLPEQKQKDLLYKGILLLERHKVSSDGATESRIESVNELEDSKDGELL